MANQNPKKCAYEGCEREVNPHYPDSEFCIFHAPLDKKGSIEEFKKAWAEQRQRRDFNCRGYVFPIPLDFSGETFSEFVDFTDAVFHHKALFEDAEFKESALFTMARFEHGAYFKGTKFFFSVYFEEARISVGADFRGAHFTKATANFNGAVISGKIFFSGARFYARAYFNEVKFSGGVDFEGTRFGEMVYFRKTRFSNWVVFNDVEFCNYTLFENTIFSDDAYFSKVKIRRWVNFIEPRFKNEVDFIDIQLFAKLTCSNAKFDPQSVVKFHNPKFDDDESKIVFKNISFISFRASFENFTSGEEWSKEGLLPKPVIIFRHCQLEDIYFSNNNMSIFSFYKSSFDKARFISNRYGKDSYNRDRALLKKYDRENIILEERLLHHLRENITDNKEENDIRNKYGIEGLDDYKEVAGLYRRMKTALDYTKDFEEAGKFYFNEYEMKRRALIDELNEKLQKRVLVSETTFDLIYYYFISLFSKRPIYWAYKTFAGYGEKPLWSFCWLFIWAGFFGFWHMLKGFRFAGSEEINYHWKFAGWDKLTEVSYWGNLIWNFIKSIIYSIIYILPRSYIPIAKEELTASSFGETILIFFNAVVLLIMILFIGIGLKRHFRRF